MEILVGNRHVCECESEAEYIPSDLSWARPSRVASPWLSPQATRAYIYSMDSEQSTAGPTIESQPEPKPIRRLQDEVINRIAAGEVSPSNQSFPVLPISRFPFPPCTRARL